MILATLLKLNGWNEFICFQDWHCDIKIEVSKEFYDSLVGLSREFYDSLVGLRTLLVSNWPFTLAMLLLQSEVYKIANCYSLGNCSPDI